MRVVALLAVHNEERFIDACLKHLIQNGVEVYVIDDGSTDETASIARKYMGNGVIAVQSLAHDGTFRLHDQLLLKEDLVQSINADWFMHVDADEIRLPPAGHSSLAAAIEEVDAAGFNAINFLEYTFVPTLENPDHDHDRYMDTMRWYYPFLPTFPHRRNAWKRQSCRVDLHTHGGHRVQFPELKMFEESFGMRHYLLLGERHLERKYLSRHFPQEELARDWHRNRTGLDKSMFVWPSQSDLRTYTDDASLDPCEPKTRHFWEHQSVWSN